MSDVTEHPNLAAALVAGLADLAVVEKGRTANAGTYKYDYADLGDIVSVTRPKLAEHGVVVLTPVCDNGSNLQVTVVLLHTSGERMEFGPFTFAHGNTAQATGSAVTYHRRYALLSALGMATGDDDDGATAAGRAATGDTKVGMPTAPIDGRIADMKPREVADALRARGLELGGSVEEMKARLSAAVAPVVAGETSTEPSSVSPSEGSDDLPGSPTEPASPPPEPLTALLDKLGFTVADQEYQVLVNWSVKHGCSAVEVCEQVDDGRLLLQYDEHGQPMLQSTMSEAERNAAERKGRERAVMAKARQELEKAGKT